MINHVPTQGFMDLFLFVLGVLATVGVVYLFALWVGRNRIPLTILLASTIWSQAATHYITQAGIPPTTNSLNGLNAYTNINAGDTVRLIGTFTNGVAITTQNRSDGKGFVGDYGNPVTFVFDAGCNFTAPAWGQYGNTANSFSNGNAFYMTDVKAVVIDGGSDGIIQATANASGWLQWSNRCDMINLNILEGSFEIKNLTITNIYRRLHGNDDAYTPGHAGDVGYIVSGNGILIGGGWTNGSVHNCNLSEQANLLAFSYALPAHNTSIYSNNIISCSFGIQVYGYYQAAATNWQIWANNINTKNTWSGGDGGTFHGDGIIVNMHQGNYKLLDQLLATNSATYSVAGYSTVNVSPSDWGDTGDYYSYYSWSPNGDTNNTGIWLGTAPGTGTNYTTATNFYVPRDYAIYMTGTPGSNNTGSVRWHPTTNVVATIFSKTNFAFYNASGYYTNELPQWGNYGSYYNYFQNGDTNNVSMLNGTNVYTITTSPFAVTNFFVLTGTPNYPITAKLGWLHAATNNNMQVYRNTFGPEWGTNATCWFFPSADMPSGFQNYKVFNNVVIIDNITSPSLMGNSVSVGDQCFFANNTMIQINSVPIGHAVQGTFGGGRILNNYGRYFSSAWDFNSINVDSRGAGRSDQIDFNVWEGITEWRSTAGNWPTLWYVSDTNSPFYGIGIYKMPEFEDNTETNTPSMPWTSGLPPLVISHLVPYSSDTVLVGKGTNLTVFASQLGTPQLTNDFYGNPRPAVGAWTIGAFEVASTNTAPSIQTQPTSQAGVTNSSLTTTFIVNGSQPLIYDWFYVNMSTIYHVLQGTNQSTWTTNRPVVDAYAYYCIVTNNFGAVTSTFAYFQWTNGLPQLQKYIPMKVR